MGTDVGNAGPINDLRTLLECGTKIQIQQHDDEVLIELIQGVDLSSSPPQLICPQITLPRSPEMDAFLASPLVQTAIFSPVTRGIMLVDIVGYSKGGTSWQCAFLTTFQIAIKRALKFPNIINQQFIEQIVPTGDGCYIVFHEARNGDFFKAVFGILSTMNVVQSLIMKQAGRHTRNGDRIRLRVGCELGETDFFYDLNRNRNCFGIGMNEAARILSHGQKTAEEKFPNESTENTIFIGEKVYPQAEEIMTWYQKIKPSVHLDDLGDVKDKHGISRRVWWMHGMSLHLGIMDNLLQTLSPQEDHDH